MYLMPRSRSTSTMRSEPYCALLFRPIPADQISGLLCASDFSAMFPPKFQNFSFDLCRDALRPCHPGNKTVRRRVILSSQAIKGFHVVFHSLLDVIRRLISEMLFCRRNVEDAVALLASA